MSEVPNKVHTIHTLQVHMHIKKFLMFNNKFVFKLSSPKVYFFSSAIYSNCSRKCPHTMFSMNSSILVSENVKNKNVQGGAEWVCDITFFFFLYKLLLGIWTTTNLQWLLQLHICCSFTRRNRDKEWHTNKPSRIHHFSSNVFYPP